MSDTDVLAQSIRRTIDALETKWLEALEAEKLQVPRALVAHEIPSLCQPIPSIALLDIVTPYTTIDYASGECLRMSTEWGALSLLADGTAYPILIDQPTVKLTPQGETLAFPVRICESAHSVRWPKALNIRVLGDADIVRHFYQNVLLDRAMIAFADQEHSADLDICLGSGLALSQLFDDDPSNAFSWWRLYQLLGPSLFTLKLSLDVLPEPRSRSFELRLPVDTLSVNTDSLRFSVNTVFAANLYEEMMVPTSVEAFTRLQPITADASSQAPVFASRIKALRLTDRAHFSTRRLEKNDYTTQEDGGAPRLKISNKLCHSDNVVSGDLWVHNGRVFKKTHEQLRRLVNPWSHLGCELLSCMPLTAYQAPSINALTEQPMWDLLSAIKALPNSKEMLRALLIGLSPRAPDFLDHCEAVDLRTVPKVKTGQWHLDFVLHIAQHEGTDVDQLRDIVLKQSLLPLVKWYEECEVVSSAC